MTDSVTAIRIDATGTEKMAGNASRDNLKNCDSDRYGRELYQLMVALYPICRSITGDGFRQSLQTTAGGCSFDAA